MRNLGVNQQLLDAWSWRADFLDLTWFDAITHLPQNLPHASFRPSRCPKSWRCQQAVGFSSTPGEEAGQGAGFYLRQQRAGFLTWVSIHQSKGRRGLPGQLPPL